MKKATFGLGIAAALAMATRAASSVAGSDLIDPRSPPRPGAGHWRARQREADKAALNREAYADAPIPAGMSRQVERRQRLKKEKELKTIIAKGAQARAAEMRREIREEGRKRFGRDPGPRAIKSDRTVSASGRALNDGMSRLLKGGARGLQF